jgi:hypothetical protein
MITSHDVIEALVDSVPPGTPEEEKMVFRLALYKLVTLAQLEKVAAISEDLKLVSQITSSYSRRFK